ncbi:Mariner Mos1 transposase [Eumeta japonica]|uniref:Mariner Mos1 transposase n=1 Tax=Eumeta variegata TaxID=151549 RepID=A0A4C1TAJ7_EUMVA|nr:Mariner Mos1 transposase [Eumeta japonica]
MIEYFDRGAIVTSSLCAEVMKKMRNEIRKKRQGKLEKVLLFHQDNASAHRSAIAVAAIRDAGFEILKHSPYSLSLAPSNFFLFPRLKENVKEQRFEDNAAVVAAVQEFLGAQDEEFFKKIILSYKKFILKVYYNKCDYVEK